MVAENYRALVGCMAGFIGSPIQTFVQRFEIKVENKNFVEHIKEFLKVAGAPTEESHRTRRVSRDRTHLCHGPHPVRVTPFDAVRAMRRPCKRPACFWVPNIGQDPITVNDMVTPPLQLGGDGRFSSAGAAFDQIVPDGMEPVYNSMRTAEKILHNRAHSTSRQV